MGIKDDMSKMWKSFTGSNGNEELETTAPVTDDIVTDAPTTDIPDEVSTDALVTDGTSTDAPGTSAPVTDMPDEDVSTRAEIERLRNELKELREKKLTTKAPSTETPISDEDFTNGLDLDDLSRDPEALNKVLNSVYRKGIETAKKTSSQSLIGLPDLVRDNITVIQTLEKTTQDFYNKNKDLKPYKDVVASVFGEVAQQNTDKSYQENLDIVSNEVRKRLNIKSDNVNKAKPPRLPRPKSQQRPTQKPELTNFESELEAMEKALNS